MRLFSEEVNYTSSSSPLNILQVENFEEIFFGVYEVEINEKKYVAEKVSEDNGNPIVSVIVENGGISAEHPFILVKGKQEIYFNPSSDPSAIIDKIEESVEEEQINSIIEESSIERDDIIDNKKQQLIEEISKIKEDATKKSLKILQQNKLKKIQDIKNESVKKQKALQKVLNESRENLVEEFVKISNKIKKDIIFENDDRFGEIRDSIDLKIQDLANSLSESLKNDFDNSSKLFDVSIKKLVKELYEKNVIHKLNERLDNIASEVTSKVSLIDKNLTKKLDKKADVSLVENVNREIDTIRDANIELNNTINKGVQKTLSRIGNVDKKVDSLSESIEKKIESVEKNIEIFCEEKIDNIKNETLDITDASRKYLVDLIEESKNNFVQEIRRIKDEKPVEYIVESNGKPQKLEHDQLLAEFDKKIHDKFENYKTDLRKYIVYASGGGTNAVQYADGGTINGDLIINGLLKADTYEGVKAQEVSYDNSLLVNGNALSATNVQSAIDELALEKVNIRDLGTNLILFPTTASSELSGFFRLVSSTSDSDFNLSAVDVATPPITSDITPILVGNLVSDAGVIIGEPSLVNITTIGSIRKVSGNRDAVFYFEVYKRSDIGVETFLCASDPTAVVTTSVYQQFSESALLPLGLRFVETDRIVIKYFGLKTESGGNDPVYEFQFGGTDPVRTLFPVPASVTIRETWRKSGDDIYYNDGNVGIGTSNPDEKLVVDGNIKADDIFSNGNRVATVVDPVRTTLTGDGITSTYAISGADSLTNPSALIVAIDGILQEPSVDYTVASGNITFTSPLPNGSKAVVISPTNSIQVGQVIPSDGSVTSAKLVPNLTLTNPTIAGNISGLATGVSDFLNNPTSANLATAIIDEVGDGPLMFQNAMISQVGLLVFRQILTSPVTTEFQQSITAMGPFTLKSNTTYKIFIYFAVNVANSGRIVTGIAGNATVDFKSYFSTHNLNIEHAGSSPTVSSLGLQNRTSIGISVVHGIFRTTNIGTISIALNCDAGSLALGSTATLRAGTYMEIYEI